MTPLLKKLLITLLLFIFVGSVMFIVMNKGDNDAPHTLTSGELEAKSTRILTDLKKIDTLKFNDVFLSDIRFTSLKNTRIDLRDVATGRIDPFAPVQ